MVHEELVLKIIKILFKYRQSMGKVKLQYISISRDYLRKFIHEALRRYFGQLLSIDLPLIYPFVYI